MPIDIIDGSLLWDGVSGGPIPPPPTPVIVESADGVALPGLPPGMLVSTTAYQRRRSRLDDLPNPWIAILRWLRVIDDTREWTADYLRMIEADDMDIVELTRLTRRRQ